ncbi:hypothetical protein RSOLAG1IB_03689 [Rhizoctonia solani AG-1 IB]|uniref:Uncharacterized protein n=1 Tax=Thanatephorus cucumeris (strain AG1-IB / isolate 7/3/14) TaxID=1108050 RepID=A0A0B7FP67_THACB|nr:hypothetical protein RSOLAG1IB_03689 [Rhizoctonia solani AG-1 IB]
MSEHLTYASVRYVRPCYAFVLYTVQVGEPGAARKRSRGIGRATQGCDRPDRRPGVAENHLKWQRKVLLLTRDGGRVLKNARIDRILAHGTPFRSRRAEWRPTDSRDREPPPSVKYRM